MMSGELGPGASDSYTVPVGTKVLVSSMVLSALTIGVNCTFVVTHYPLGGVGEPVVKGAIGNSGDLPNPFPVTEPWFVLLATDQIEVENLSPVGGPNLSYVFAGILFDPP